MGSLKWPPQVQIPISVSCRLCDSFSDFAWLGLDFSICEMWVNRDPVTSNSNIQWENAFKSLRKMSASTHQRYAIITVNQAGCASRWALLPLHSLQTPSLAFRTPKPLFLLTCVMDRYPWSEAGTETKGTWGTWVGLPLLWLQWALGQRDAASWSFFVLFPPKQVPFLPSHHSCATL